MVEGVAAYGRSACRAWARLGWEVRHDLLGEGAYFLIEHQAAPVAVGGFSGDGRAADLAWLRYLFVAPTWARRGLGRRLVGAIEQAAVGAGRPRVMVWASLNALPFYGALGYRTLRAGRWPVAAGIELTFQLMARELLAGAALAAVRTRC